MTRTDGPDAQDVSIWHARRVVTLHGGDAEAVAVADGRILAAGTYADVSARWPSASRIPVDGVLLPGFHDAHLHFLAAVAAEHAVPADPASCPTVNALMSRIAERAAAQPVASWILATGYDDSSLPDSPSLDRSALDRAAPTHPVVVLHVAGHWGVANSTALRLAGYLEDVTGPMENLVGRDGAGNPNGYLYESALSALEFPELSTDDWLRCARRVNARFHAAGLTSVGDALVRGADVGRLVEAERSGDLTLRLAMLVDAADFDPELHLQARSERLTFSGAKWFMDGAIGGRTALLDAPYEGRLDCGIEVTDIEEAAQIAARVHRQGGRVAVHANGDRAIRNLLDVLESVARDHGPLRRPRVEHCSIIDAGLLTRLRELGTVVLPFAAYTRM